MSEKRGTKRIILLSLRIMLLSLFIGVIAFIISIFEAGWVCELTISMYLIASLGSLLGFVPFIGPILYYFGVGRVFNLALENLELHMPISTTIIFYGLLEFSIIFCFLTTSILVLSLFSRKELEDLIESLKGRD